MATIDFSPDAARIPGYVLTGGLKIVPRFRVKQKSRGTPFKKGNPGNPWGRKGKNGTGKLTSNKLREARIEWLAKNGTLTPLEFFLGVMRDSASHLDYRLEAAKCAAPYVHRKMPIAIEGGDPAKPVMFEASALAMLDSKEKMMLLALVEKMSLNLAPTQPSPKALIEHVSRKEIDVAVKASEEEEAEVGE